MTKVQPSILEKNLTEEVNHDVPFLEHWLHQGTKSTSCNLLTAFSTKVNLLCLLYSMDWRCCLLHLIKQNYLLKTFPRTQILMTLVSLYLFSLSRTNLKLHNISITPKMVKEVKKDLSSVW